jgi:hypothetical protein
MRNSDEEILLLVTTVMSFITMLIDDIYENILFKLLKLLSVCLSIYFAWSRYKTSKPFYLTFKSNDWRPAENGFQITILRTTHQRGKSPTIALQHVNIDGSVSQISGRVESKADGTIIVLSPVPYDMRIEIRK